MKNTNEAIGAMFIARRKAMTGMKTLAASIAILLASGAQAYYGTFDPQLQRNQATITIVDSQAPNVDCATRVHPLMMPLVLATGMGCFDPATETLVAPITPGPMWLYMIGNALILPDQLLGHELRHAFEYNFHPPVLAFLESNRMRSTAEVSVGMVSRKKHD